MAEKVDEVHPIHLCTGRNFKSTIQRVRTERGREGVRTDPVNSICAIFVEECTRTRDFGYALTSFRKKRKLLQAKKPQTGEEEEDEKVDARLVEHYRYANIAKFTNWKHLCLFPPCSHESGRTQ